jgi:hypothetical protein
VKVRFSSRLQRSVNERHHSLHFFEQNLVGSFKDLRRLAAGILKVVERVSR